MSSKISKKLQHFPISNDDSHTVAPTEGTRQLDVSEQLNSEEGSPKNVQVLFTPNTDQPTSATNMFINSEIMSDSLAGLKPKPTHLAKPPKEKATEVIPPRNNIVFAVNWDCSLSISSNSIKDIFFKVARKKNYEVIEEEYSEALVVRKEKVSLRDMLYKCIPGKYNNSNINAIRIKISTDKVNCSRVVTVKALHGNKISLKEYVDEFKKNIQNLEKKSIMNVTNMPYQQYLGEASLHFNQALMKHHIESLEENPESALNIMQGSVESSAYYYFHKILSSDLYTIGRKTRDFIRDFFLNYRSIKESADLLPQPLESVLHLINEIVQILFSEFNYGKSETKNIMQYCKTSVEKYLFERVFSHLLAMYKLKNSQEEENLKAKISSLNSLFDQFKILQELEIKKKYWLLPQDTIKEDKELAKPLEEHQIPYIIAVRELNKLKTLQTPYEKLNCLLMMNSMIKTSVSDFYKGKEELSSMDDELPIMIFVVSQSKVDDLTAELNFIDDYVSFYSQLEAEKRLLTNLKVSAQYISKEWKFEEKVKRRDNNIFILSNSILSTSKNISQMNIIVNFSPAFAKDFQHSVEKFPIFLDSNETVDNLKTIISLKFTDLDPSEFELQHKSQVLRSSLQLFKIPLKDGDSVTIVKAQKLENYVYFALIPIFMLLFVLIVNSVY